MSQSDRQPQRPDSGDADLGDAIRQLETLLDSQADDGSPASEKLPLLDDIVADDDSEPAADDHAAAPSAVPAAAGPDPQQIRQLLDQLAEQLETELETVVGMLKYSVLTEFRNELAAALKLDPQQLDSADQDSNDDSAVR